MSGSHRIVRRRWLVALGALAVTAALASCGGAPSAGTSAGSSGNTKSGASVETVSIALPHKGLLTTSLPYAVAVHQGFFKQQGIAVKPVYTSGGGNTVQSVISGNIDIAPETGPASVFSAYEHGAPLKIVSSTMTGLDLIFFAKGSSPYHAIKDLSGQKVGFSEPGSSSDEGVGAINVLLKQMGKAPAKPVAIGGPPDQLTAVETGQIAAGFTAAPLFFDKIAAGKLRIIAQPKDFTSYSNTAVRVTFTSDAFIQKHAKALRGFLTAWHQAWDWSFAHKTQATQIYKKAFQNPESVALIKKSFDFYTPKMVRVAPIENLDQAAQDAYKAKLISKPLTSQDLSKLVDASYAPTGP